MTDTSLAAAAMVAAFLAAGFAAHLRVLIAKHNTRITTLEGALIAEARRFRSPEDAARLAGTFTELSAEDSDA